ncbi:MAG: hypothetical protein QMD71_01410 [bacterium]|nr:hypothetical protein [bacterium]
MKTTESYQSKSLKVISLFLFLLPAFVFGVSTLNWEVTDFEACKLKNVMLDKDGFARISSEVKCVWDNPEVYIWSLLEIGNTVYVGTGASGKIYKIERGKDTLLFDTKATGVFSLNTHKGKIYAGTAPNGVIYVIDKTGVGKVLYETGEKYVWDIVFDESDNLYAATGTTGKILRITKAGILDTFYVTGDMNVTSLVYFKPYLYAGTGERGLLFKIDKQGKGMCIYDADESEITSIILKDSLLFISVTEDTLGSVYKIYPDNRIDRLWHTNSAIRGLQEVANKFFVAAGNRVYRVDTAGNVELLFELPTDISCMLNNWVGTSEVGKLYKIDEGMSKSGTIESASYDTKGVSEWGRLEFKSVGNIEFRTRSGNLSEPDKTWEEWKPISRDGKVMSSNARFIQWEAVLKGPESMIKAVKLSYLPQNEKPKIININILKPKPKEDVPEGARLISWSATDPNGDSLCFNIYFKLTDEKKWLLLKESVLDTFYYIDPKTFIDGEYEFKVEASDSLSNPKAYAMKSDKVSSVYLIDNTPPDIKIGSVEHSMLSFKVTDNLSYIEFCDYACDGGKWEQVFPVDKIFDSRAEEFIISVKDAHKVVIRTGDVCGNVSLKSKVIK